MSIQASYHVVLFKSVSYALKAEKVIKAAGLPYKLIPVPKQISADCGICMRFESAFQDQIIAALAGKVEIEGIRTVTH